MPSLRHQKHRLLRINTRVTPTRVRRESVLSLYTREALASRVFSSLQMKSSKSSERSSRQSYETGTRHSALKIISVARLCCRLTAWSQFCRRPSLSSQWGTGRKRGSSTSRSLRRSQLGRARSAMSTCLMGRRLTFKACRCATVRIWTSRLTA